MTYSVPLLRTLFPLHRSAGIFLVVFFLANCSSEQSGDNPEAVCGNGVPESHEECDDGNRISTDSCTVECTIARCGDGYHFETAEDCDDGNNSNLDGCTNTCSLPVCGNGVLEGSESCDAGAANSDVLPDACRSTCVAAQCGDGVTDADEACDDANLLGDDGCSPSCAVQEGWRCDEPAGLPSQCSELCVTNDLGECICPDHDEDGICNDEDNCPLDHNPSQVDSNHDGVGNRCEPDPDADGYQNEPSDAADDPNTFPGAEELCDGVDNNLNGLIDEGTGCERCPE